MRPDADANRANLALGLEHLRRALRYADRGRKMFFDAEIPDTFLLVEGELRKAYESLNRLGRSFWTANPALPRDRIGEMRQLLTHEYVEVDRTIVWRMAHGEGGPLLRRLAKAKIPKEERTDSREK
jgi:uncharacterized protein with HEPN domain